MCRERLPLTSLASLEEVGHPFLGYSQWEVSNHGAKTALEVGVWMLHGGSSVCSVMPAFATPCNVACQAPLSMKFSRQEYWGGVAISYSSGSSWPSDWTPISCIFLHWQAGPLPTVPPGKAWMLHNAKQLIITRKSQEMAFIHLELKIENAFPIIQLPFSLPVAQLVKNPPAMRETWVWSLSWEDPQKKGKATHSSILA